MKVSAVNGKSSCQESPRRYFSATFPRSSKKREQSFLHDGKSDSKCKDICLEATTSAVNDDILVGNECKVMEKLRHLVEHQLHARDNVSNKFEKSRNDHFLDIKFTAPNLHHSCSNDQITLMSEEHKSPAFQIRDTCPSTMFSAKVTGSNVNVSPPEIRNNHTFFQEKHSQHGKLVTTNASIQAKDSLEKFYKFGNELQYGNDRTGVKNGCKKRSNFDKVSSISPVCIMMKDHYDQGILTISEAPVDPVHDPIMMINTVSENVLKFTKREVKDAEVAQQLYTMLGKPSMKDYLNMIRHNHIKDCPVTVKDVERALAIYGKDLGTIMGRTVSYKPDSLNDEIFVRREKDYTSLCKKKARRMEEDRTGAFYLLI